MGEDRQVLALCQTLPRTNIITLEISNNNITDKAAPVLCEALCQCLCLKSFICVNVRITAASVVHLAKLAAHPPLAMLFLDSMQEGDVKLIKAWADAEKTPGLLMLA